MVDRRSLRLLLPEPLRALPADLVGVLAVTLLVNIAVFVPIVRETPLRIVLGLIFVLFVPGYVFIAALFPEAGESPTAGSDHRSETKGGESEDRPTDDWGTESGWGDANSETAEDAGLVEQGELAVREGIDGIERVALSFGLSIAIVPLIGLVLNFTPWGIRLVPIMIAATGFTVLTAAVAAIRRWQLPPEDRFSVPYRAWYETGRSEMLEPESRVDGLLNVVLVLSILLAVGTVTFAVVVPPQGEQFSAVYILTEDDDGDLVADGYPTSVTAGDSAEIVVGVDNNEHRTVEYTIVVLEQHVEFVPNETSTDPETLQENETVVTEQNELDRFNTRLEHNESWHHSHEFEPTIPGENTRVVWLLFPDGDVPENPSMDDTEYTVHLWVDVDG
ncbi:DUF1616 domain-containing protein [Natrarchaeobius chitinivorans]|uniref:DUF1616 domain-containing protein n=1 Tax=Natrarchaeobius chitinivorans TaxID=1679083 RepID=A0A3N6M621_NATCH|nr:DUF1616 domain-containing protein [Natrarchaeobius chitinivorans]RQG96014.1 DUF1616 domain-containing protein [Natrarchaeobius chitinivorans]